MTGPPATVLLVAAAFAGNVVGHHLGRAAGPAIFGKPESRLFKPEHVARTQEFFDRYGTRAGPVRADRPHLHHGDDRRRRRDVRRYLRARRGAGGARRLSGVAGSEGYPALTP